MPHQARANETAAVGNDSIAARIQAARDSLTPGRLSQILIGERQFAIRTALTRLKIIQDENPADPAVQADIAGHGKVSTDPNVVNALIQSLLRDLPTPRSSGIAPIGAPRLI